MLGHWAALLPVPSHSPTPSPNEANALGVWALQLTPRVTELEDAVLAQVQADLLAHPLTATPRNNDAANQAAGGGQALRLA